MAETTVAPTTNPTAEAPAPATREETRFLIPPVDIFEKADSLCVVADLPGVDKDGVNVHVENGTLTIEGTPRLMSAGEEFHSEFSVMRYFRQFELPNEIDSAKIVADLKNGVLTINLPKAEKARPRKVEVRMLE